MEGSNGKHHEHPAIGLRGDPAKPDRARLEIRQRRSDQMAGHLDRHRRQETAGHGLNHQVSGFRANVTVNDASEGLQSARTFITTNNTFRIADSQFALTGTGKARLTTIVTDPTTGNQSRLTVPLTLKT